MHIKNLSKQNLFLSGDWGTSSFRLKLANLESGSMRGDISSSNGIQKVHEEWSQQQKAEKREEFYLRYVKEAISQLEQNHSISLRSVPVLLSGMASSGIGLKELPYARVPLHVDASGFQLDITAASDTFPHDLILISGISSDVDIMRGEETQLAGLSAEYNFQNALCLLPGTHSKHVYLRDHKITGFKTFMTGELFALISRHSILKNSVSGPGERLDTRVFHRGIKRASDDNLLHALFTIRARDVLAETDPNESYDFLSGLLIGQELKELKLQNYSDGPIILAGESNVNPYYAEALHFLNLNQSLTVLSPEKSAELTVKGHRLILKNL